MQVIVYNIIIIKETCIEYEHIQSLDASPGLTRTINLVPGPAYTEKREGMVHEGTLYIGV